MIPPGTLAHWTSVLGTAVVAQSGDSFWLPPPESTTADAVDAVFKLVLVISAIFFVLIVSLMLLFVVLYRRRPGVEPGDSPSHNTALEVTWTVIPVAIVIVIFYWGFTTYMDIRTPPANAYDVRVTAKQWSWLFTYANGAESNELHVPVDRPIRLTMQSLDVIHSLYVPDFRLKMDIVPGRYTQTWFRARRPGVYDLYCAEYCGNDHSDMLSKVVVHEPGQFDQWLEEAANFLDKLSPVEAGEKLYQIKGCSQCHSTDGSPKEGGGPSFKGIYGQTHQFANAPDTVVDDNYIRESILEPNAKVRKGYRGVMPVIKVKDEEITAIIEFIKSLK